tara:strand:- start:106 stop:348 length:243 start_codon:yes stop_codon:yes gene_type:complete
MENVKLRFLTRKEELEQLAYDISYEAKVIQDRLSSYPYLPVMSQQLAEILDIADALVREASTLLRLVDQLPDDKQQRSEV